MIGRQREVADVIDRLSARRLVTVIGPGGIGKTTIATAVAGQIGSEFELGAHFVDLTRVDTPADVAGAIAGQLGFPTFEALLAAPSEQPALVVVDNCEHVTAAAADAVEALLAACTSPTVLATSRSPLDLPDESLVVIGPLAVPPPGTAGESDAVALFLERARDAGATIEPSQLPVVSELCRRLDGVPLALELAAARTRTMGPAEILARLDEGVDVLSRPRFRGAERHRSLTATIEWSHRLLPPDAAALFDRLGVATGPFTAGLAEAVGADIGLDSMAAADALAVLVDSTLVVADRRADVTRFRLLEAVRAYAIYRLDATGSLAEARGRLADHVVTEATDILFEGARNWSTSLFARLLSLYDNIAAALRWGLVLDDDGTRCRVLVAVLWGVVHQGHTDEIGALGEEMLERFPDLGAPFAADAAATVATARCLLGDPDGSIELAERALPSASPTAAVTLRRAMGYSARALGRTEEALALFEEVSRLGRDRDLLALALEADVTCAQLLAELDRLDEAIERAERARDEALARGSVVNEVWAESVRANFVLRRDLRAGIAEVEASLVRAREIAYPAAISVSLRSLAWALTRMGDLRGAAAHLVELFDSVIVRSGVADLRGAVYTAAELLHQAGDPAWAPLAATARSLPQVALMGRAVDDLVPLPPTDAEPLSRRDAVALARARIQALVAADAPIDTADAVPAEIGAGLAGPGAEAASIADHGDYWDITFAGTSVHVRAAKGLADLARLLTQPGREVHCLELMGAAVEQPDTGATLDATARRRYEERIRELQGDVEEAEADNDVARAERAQAELDTIVDHLTAALGLGGAGRRTGATAEKARSAVTQRIRGTVRRLGQAHPALGRHLEASIVTGTFCVYRPERPVTWTS